MPSRRHFLAYLALWPFADVRIADAMTDTSNLDDLANAISHKSPAIKTYAQAQAAASQSQELDIRSLLERVSVLETVPQTEPEPPSAELPFAEATLENPVRPTIFANQTSFNCETGKDYLIDLGMVLRETLVLTGSPRNVQIRNAHFRIDAAMSQGPYWRGGLGLQLKCEHVSITDYFVEAGFSGCTLTDGFRLATTPQTKVTLQRFRIEGRENSNEPAEHCDAFQVQGPVGRIELGLGTAYAPGVQPPNHGGKCFQIAHEAPAGFPTPGPFSVAFKHVNMVGLGSGGAKFGTMFIRGPERHHVSGVYYGPITETLEDVWVRADGDGHTDFSGWFATYTPGPVGTVTGSSPNRRITFDPASKITGHISEGGTDFVTRSMLGV